MKLSATTTNSNHQNDDHQQQIMLLNWFVLHRLKHSFLKRIRSFLVFGDRGTEVLLIIKDDDDHHGHVDAVYAFGENQWPSLALGHRDPVIINNHNIDPTTTTDSKQICKSNQPEEIQQLRNRQVIDLVYGHRHVMALTINGDIYSWGDNRFGQLGTLNAFESLKPILVGNHIVRLACGANHTLALTTTGQVFAWGRNNYGQIGIGTNGDQMIPVKVTALEPYYVKMVSCGGSHSFALTDDGQMFGWGGNSFGQLGIGNCTHQTTPTLVKFPIRTSTIKSIACGEYHTLILMSNGEIFSCGRNDQYQLGCNQVPSSEGSCVPVRVTSQERFQTIASHFATSFSVAMATTGYCFVWGDCANQENDRPIREPRQTPLISIQDTFAVYCRRKVTPSLYNIDDEQRLRMKMMGSRLVERLRQSFNDKQTSDIEFIVDGKSIFVHRWFLQLSSTYLNRMLSDEWIDTASNDETISVDGFQMDQAKSTKKLTRIEVNSYSYEVFFSYLKYLYTDVLEMDNKDQTSSLMEMLDLANCYLDNELKQRCVIIMRNNITIDNCCQYYQLSIKYQLKEFERQISIFIFNNIYDVCRSSAFKSMTGDFCKTLMISVCESNFADLN